MNPTNLRLPIFLGILGAVLLPAQAQAGFVEFTTTGTSAGVPVSSTASFLTSPGELTISLANTTAHTADAGQLLTGIRFIMAPNPLPTALLVSATAIPRTVADNGTYVDGAPQNILGSWEANRIGTYYQLDFNPDAKFAIIGPADGETATTPGVYNGNGSINGNSGHNPFTAKNVTFKLGSPGINPDTVITSVAFIYNTGLTRIIPGTPHTTELIPEVPEPATMGFGLAILGVCGAARRRQA